MIGKLKQCIGQRSPIRLGWHFLKAFLAALCYGFPARPNWFGRSDGPAWKLTVIGITGTDGKTTVVGMTAHILQKAGIPTGALSTAYLSIKEEHTWNETQKTSPSPFLVQRFLHDLVSAGCTHAVLEYSSHGLVQGRTNYTWPTIAAITNTSMEHLDYHETMEQYRRDKAKLFQMLRGRGTKVLNADDETYQLYLNIPSERTIAYANHALETEDSLWLSDISLSAKTSSATLSSSQGETYALELAISGSFNLENALCAIGAAHAAGVPLDQCVDALRSFEGTPGRMELIEEEQSFFVFVDFTVTPVAYEKTLRTVREMIEPGKRVLVLAGSCGDRMKEKRPHIGRICSERADIVVIANEDPYTEDPQAIIDEVWAGVDESLCEAHRIFDRKEAMQFLFKNAEPGDAVILCGKGSDTTMWMSDGQVPWNEREIAKELLRSLRA